jgi:hypothetical protein
MKKHLSKIFTTLLGMLIVVSFFGIFSVQAAGQIFAQNNILTPEPQKGLDNPPLEPSQIVAQEKAMGFLKNMLPIDLQKYSINLRSNSIMYGVPLAKDDNRVIINILYELNSTDSYLHIGFAFEKGIMTSCEITPIEGQIITNRQYDNSLIAAKDFLERYQAYTKIDSNNLITMLNNVDITKDSTVTKENTKLTITNSYSGGRNNIVFSWVQVINGVESRIGTSLVFDTDGNFVSLGDSRALYTVGDMSINISKKRVIDIALENLKYYSYELPDGSMVKDFKVSKDSIVATLVTASVDYELRPYWDVRMTLDEVYPGNVHGITAFIWANTGVVISYSNMAYGGTYYLDDAASFSDTGTPSITSNNTLTIAVIAVTAVTVAAVVVIGLVVKKKETKAVQERDLFD